MLVLIFAHFMDLMDVTIVNVALPSIRADLGASPAHLEWVVGAYTLGFAAVLITAGRLGDIVGRKRVFVAGVLTFTLTSLVAGLTHSPDILVAARALQGISAGLMMPQVLASVQSLYAPAERAPIYGTIGAVAGLAAVIGPLLGGWLITHDLLGLGWRAVFMINIPVGVLLALSALLWVPDTRSADRPRLDVLGAVLATSGVGLVALGLIEGPAQDWDGGVWAALIAGPVILLGWLVHQRRLEVLGRDPLVAPHLFSNRGFSAGLLIQGTFQGAMAGFFFALIIYLQAGRGFSAWDAGLSLLPFSVMAFLGSGAAVALTAGAGKFLVAVGALMLMVGTLWTARMVDAAPATMTWHSLLVPLALCGLGLGLFVVPLIDVALATVDIREAGAASGTYGMVQQLGAALGIAVVGVVFFGRAGRFDLASLTGAMVAAAVICAIGYTVCALAALALPSPSDVTRRLAEVAEADES
ncbi:MAG: MFS transporter [Dermatophilaceae bacterium]